MTSGKLAPRASLFDTLLFDLGRVLLDWDPRYYYSRHFEGRAAELEHFVQNVIAIDWITEMDAGKTAAQAIAERQRLYPEYAPLLALWEQGRHHMIRGEIEETVQIVRRAKAQGLRLYALTNYSAETFPAALKTYPCLALFEDIVVSGDLGLIKPDPRIFAHTIAHCRLEPARTVFVDDNPANVAAGRAAGLTALQFTSPAKLREDLAALGLKL